MLVFENIMLSLTCKMFCFVYHGDFILKLFVIEYRILAVAKEVSFNSIQPNIVIQLSAILLISLSNTKMK